MNWSDFLQKLKDAKKQKKTKGLSVPTITNLIFSGAFDDMVVQFDGPKFKTYRIMYEDVKKALKSKAALPAKKKDDLIALSEVKTEAHLQIWRHQVNPTTSFSFVDGCMDNMKLLGYERVHRGSIEAVKKHITDSGIMTHESIVVGDWSNLPDDNSHPVMRDLLSGKRHIGAVGVITDIKKQSYKAYDGGSREMIKVELFNGYGYIKDLIVWPERNGRTNEYLKENLKKGRLGILDMSMSINKKNGSRSFAIQTWHGFMDA